MKIALFAATKIGLRIADIFRKKNQTVEYLVYNEKDSPEIIDALKNINIYKKIMSWNEFLSASQTEFDLGILAWWPFILKEDCISKASSGYLNFHPSLLPYGRGKNPNFWAIVEETPFGVSLQWVDKTIDGGSIAFQKEIAVSWEDTGQTLYQKAQQEIIELFKTHFESIVAGDIPSKAQLQNDRNRIHYAKELDKVCYLDLDRKMTVREVLNLLRARTFEGNPSCHFEENNINYEVRIKITKK